jgi:thiamine biosynthesis lipoprotein
MGTTARVVVDGPRARVEPAVRRLRELEARWSRFVVDSEVSRLNRAGGNPVIVSADTVALLEHARFAGEITGGRFDPLLHDELVALGYDRTFTAVDREGAPLERGPSPSRQRDAAPVVDPNGGDEIVVDGAARLVRLPPHRRFDPGGIGKGLAADLVATELVAGGACAALVDVGGDLRVAGAPRPWTVVVEDAFDPARDLATLVVASGAVATSSRLRRTWRRGDEDLHHLLDPATRRPAVTDLVSVTVLAASAWWAEVAAKVALIGGRRYAFELLERHALPALVVGEDGVVERVHGFSCYETVAA